MTFYFKVFFFAGEECPVFPNNIMRCLANTTHLCAVIPVGHSVFVLHRIFETLTLKPSSKIE
jgi:hypothetical protein